MITVTLSEREARAILNFDEFIRGRPAYGDIAELLVGSEREAALLKLASALERQERVAP